MNWHHVGRKVLITGKSKTGKTTLFLTELAIWPARWKIVYDPEREASQKLGWFCATAPNQLAWAVSHCRPVCFDGCDMFPGDRPGAFEFLAGWVLEWARIKDDAGRPMVNGPKLLAVDELQSLTTTGTGGIGPNFAEILDAGRREEIDLLCIAQRLNGVHHVVRSQLTDIVTFKHTEKLSLDWLAEADFDPQQVKNLPAPGVYLHWRDSSGTIERRGRTLPAHPARGSNRSCSPSRRQTPRNSRGPRNQCPAGQPAP